MVIKIIIVPNNNSNDNNNNSNISTSTYNIILVHLNGVKKNTFELCIIIRTFIFGLYSRSIHLNICLIAHFKYVCSNCIYVEQIIL